MPSNNDSLQSKIYRSYNFQVYIQDKAFGFSKISNIEQEQEVEEFSIGGLNGGPWIAISPNKKSGRLILERGICSSDQEIKKWRAGYYIKGPITIIAYKEKMVTAEQKNLMRQKSTDEFIQYHIPAGIIVKCEVSPLDASQSELLIQKVEIAHTGLKRD